MGNGAAMTPWLSGTQTGAHVAYPGGAFCVDYNTSTGNYNINRYLYRTVQTNTCALANSGSGGVAVMTCNTAIINMGFARGQAYVAGGGSATCPAYMGGGTNCFAGTIASGGVNSAGTAVTFTAAAGTTFSAQSTKVEFYRLQPGDPVITGGGLGASGCAPHLTTPNTQVYVYLYVDADGNAGFSEGVGSQFEEGTYRCQWTGKMAGFFENNFYPSLRTEDNASHPYFNIHTSGGNGYATAWEQVTRSSRPAMQYTSVEDTGLCPNYSGAFGGACYAHPSGTGVVGIYDRAYENADWNFLQ